MIIGRTVALGPILPVDIPRLFQWSDDPEAARMNEPYLPLNWQRQEAFWLNAEADPTRIFFAIRARADAEIVGTIQIMNIQPIHRSATIGIRIGEPRDRGQGYGREALDLAIRYCWDSINITRLALTVFAGNDPALALYRRLGFQQEGVMERALFVDGQWTDLIVMALLHPDRRIAR